MTSFRSRRSLITGAVAVAALGTSVAAQGAPAETAAPAAGQIAPDFALPGATRHGVLRDEVRLSDYRGRTVVLAFFFKARTRG